MALNVLVFGGSRNIGYHTSIRLLEQGATVTFFLRNISIFDNDDVVQKYISSNKAFLVKGDSLVADDVRRVWEAAENASSGPEKRIDIVLFTIGPKAGDFSITRGVVIKPANLVTQSFLNLLCATPLGDESAVASSSSTRLIIITSSGITRESHKALPLLLKPLYNWLLDYPHRDKYGAERVLAYCAGWEWDEVKDGPEPQEAILEKGWRNTQGLPKPGSLKNVLVLRPMLFTDGECRADAKGDKAYRVSEKTLKSSYTVSRKDVAHFMFHAATTRWNEYAGKAIYIGY